MDTESTINYYYETHGGDNPTFSVDEKINFNAKLFGHAHNSSFCHEPNKEVVKTVSSFQAGPFEHQCREEVSICI